MWWWWRLCEDPAGGENDIIWGFWRKVRASCVTEVMQHHYCSLNGSQGGLEDRVKAHDPRAHAGLLPLSLIFRVHLNVGHFSCAVCVGWIGLPIKVVFLFRRCDSLCSRWGRCFCCRAACTNEQNGEERGQKGNQTLNPGLLFILNMIEMLCGHIYTHTQINCG